jgi:hypothetical protein
MRKLFLALPLLWSLQGFAQEQKPNYDSYLPKKFFSEVELFAGPAISTIRGWDENHVDTNIKIGYSYGAAVSHYLGKRLKLSGKLFFERKGTVAEFTVYYFDDPSQTYIQARGTEAFEFNYFTFSLLPCYIIGKRLQIAFGPYVSYLDKANITQYFSYNSYKSHSDVTELYEQFDGGISATMGYRIPIKSNVDLSFQMLHTFGLVEIAKNNFEGQSTKTNNTSVLFGIIFNR